MDTKTWNEIVKDIHAQFDLDDCLNTSIEKAADLLNVERGSLMLLDKENQELSMRAARGIRKDIVKNIKTKIGEGVSGWVAQNKEPLLIEDITKDERFRANCGGYYDNSLLSVPLLTRDELLGVINISNKSSRDAFNQSDLDALKEISAHISTAVDKALKYREAKKMSRLKMDFLAIVSHELRTPLTCIKEGLSLLMDGCIGILSPEQKRVIGLSQDNVERAMGFIEELLDLSRMETGRFSMNRSLQDLCGVMRQVCGGLAIEADRKRARLNLKMPEAGINMWFDQDQIIRVLVNITRDAIKSVKDNGVVDVRLEDLGRLVRISVTDNGPLLPEEDLGKVFDKYHSGLRSELRGIKSTGLGLPIVKEIIQLHRGRIWVDSSEEIGTTFSFTLPKDIKSI